MKGVISLLALILIFSKLSFSQFTYEKQFSEPRVFFEPFWKSAVKIEDIDGDGDQDVLINGKTGWDDRACQYLNLGQAEMIDMEIHVGYPLTYLPGLTESTIEYEDIDLDGDLDLLVHGLSSSLLQGFTYVYENIDGLGNYGYPQNISDFIYGTISTGDVDGDSDIDIIVSGGDPNISFYGGYRILLNNGVGGFSSSNELPYFGLRNSSSILKDFDGDNDLDYICNGDGSGNGIGVATQFFKNDGTGSFSLTPNSLINTTNGNIKEADVDNDNDLDLLITGLDPAGLATCKLYINNGIGVFTESPTLMTGVYNSCVEFADLDNDNDLDVLIMGDTTSSSPIIECFLNDGTGQYTQHLIPGIPALTSGDFDFGDIDDDGNLDLVISGKLGAFNEYSEMFLNDGNANFSKVVMYFESPISYDHKIAHGDINNDNHLDLFITGQNFESEYFSKLLINDGTGENYLINDTSFFIGYHPSSSMADFDNDSDLDILMTGNTMGILYKNDGFGDYSQFSLTSIDSVSNSSHCVADFDNDLDLDVFIQGKKYSNITGQFEDTNVLYLNNGTGQFSNSMNYFPHPGGNRSFNGDIDGDNDEDLLIIGWDGSLELIYLYLNDGIGGFLLDQNNVWPGWDGITLELGDIEGDDDLDILIAGNPDTGGVEFEVYLNDGSGNFTESLIHNLDPGNDYYIGELKLSDLDQDGDNDLITSIDSHYTDNQTRIYENNGGGNFSEIVHHSLVSLKYGNLELVDLNNDSYPDLIGSGYERYITANSFSSIESKKMCELYLTVPCLAIIDSSEQQSCISILSPGGQLMSSSGTYMDTIRFDFGCDSIFVTEFTLVPNTINTNVEITQTGLSAVDSNMDYQWINCYDNSMVNGEINQTFTPPWDDIYAVVISNEYCSDTSECIDYFVELTELLDESTFIMFPNPSESFVQMQFSNNNVYDIDIIDNTGRILIATKGISNGDRIDISELASGSYYISPRNSQFKTQLLIKN